MAFDFTRIMIVEDNSDMAACVAELLRHSGYLVEIAADNDLPLPCVPTEDFCITVMDIHFPRGARLN